VREKIKSYLQFQLNFSSLDADKILYCIKGVLSEFSKLLIIFLVALPFGYADEILIATFVLLSIRCNCGGLHFSHYISCLMFTSAFFVTVVFLSGYPLPNIFLALGLLISLGAFTIIGPITSSMRPRLTPSEVQKYSHRVTFLLLFYSSVLILLESLPYRNLIYWVIVLQIFQLLCAKVARKGEIYEKIYDTKNL
jgi:accessory gene regulator protein AgrB